MESSNNINEEQNLPKKRGRKKKIISDENIQSKKEQSPDVLETLQIEQVKKKRGRKKKWEVETTTKVIQNISYFKKY